MSKLTETEMADTFAAAMDKAIAEGKGWKSPEERQAYLDRITDDDNLPALFCETQEEFDRSPEAQAFAQLMVEGETDESMMSKCKEKGNESFALGRQNKANNVQYYRDAINHYSEALAWAEKVVPTDGPNTADVTDAADDVDQNAEGKKADNNGTGEKEEVKYTTLELNKFKSTLASNRAMAHTQLKNWGFVVDNCNIALRFDETNVKAYFRLAKAHQSRREWELAYIAAEKGLALEPDNKDLLKMVKAVEQNARNARVQRQKKERARAERVGYVKRLWRACKNSNIKLGRVPLIATLNDDDVDEEEEEQIENQWGYHHPHSGKLPKFDNENSTSVTSWPVLFVYPSHHQSDFIEKFESSEMLAMQMAEMFPHEGPTPSWDYNNEFTCDKLAIYFEVHEVSSDISDGVVFWESVEKLSDMGSCMNFFENARALKGDDGLEAQEKARTKERTRLGAVKRKWAEKRGKWARPDLPGVVRVHPAMTLIDVLTDERCVVANFIPSFILIPEEHEAHKKFCKEREVLGLLAPKE